MKVILRDSFGRTIDYARISITDRCNLRCFYCMPAKGVKLIDRSEILSYSEILRISKIFTGLGINKIRITGGEPLIREDADEFIGDLLMSCKNTEVAVTTNGTQLDKHIGSFVKAGLKKINISLDTLNKGRYYKITRSSTCGPDQIVDNIKKALRFGIKDIKINSVLSGIDDYNDARELISLALELGISIKFIEIMNVHNLAIKQTRDAGYGSHGNKEKTFNSKNAESCSFSEKILNILSDFGEVKKSGQKRGFGPAVYFKADDSKAEIGVVSGDLDFCSSCNRLRLTPEGKLKLCLYGQPVLDLRKMVRGNYKDIEIANEIAGCVKNKPYSRFSGADNKNNGNCVPIPDFMNKIGG